MQSFLEAKPEKLWKCCSRIRVIGNRLLTMTNTPAIPSRRKVGRSIAIEAGKALNKDKTVFLVPLISFLAHLAVLVVVAVLWIIAIPFQDTNPNGTTIVNIALGIVTVITFAFINVGTQATVMSMANEVFEGKNPSIASSYAVTMKHLKPLAGFALLEGTVGLILRALQRSANDNLILKAVASLVSFLAGLAWAVASYFAIAFIIFKGETSIESIKKSTALVKEKWGAALRVNVVVGALVTVAFMITAFGIAGGFALTLQGSGLTSNSENNAQLGAGILLLVVAAIVFAALLLINSTLMAYVRVALFRYATGQELPGFDTSNLDRAFVTSKMKKFRLGGSN